MVKKASANAYLIMLILGAAIASSCASGVTKVTNKTINATGVAYYEMTCTKPIEINGQLDYPCGKCMACRIQRTNEWAVRLMHESSTQEHSIFVTLTYDDEHLPPGNNLVKKHLQNFIRYLRKEIPNKIKYYGTGEFGETTGRAHYHLIIFGLENTKETKELIEKVWNKGRIDVGTCTFNSCRYVASYIQKKLYKQPTKKNSQVFSLMSQGLGLDWAISESDRLARTERVTVQGKPMGIPRYYVKKLGLDLSKSSQEQQKRTEETYRMRLLATEQSDTSILYDTVLQSKAQKERNIQAKNNLYKKKL